MDNKDFIFKSLKALESHGKVKEIHTMLTDSVFCGAVFGITWESSPKTKMPILKPLLPNMDKDSARKNPSGRDVYYADTITLDGMEYLVYNNWFENVRNSFFEWVKGVVFPELNEIEKILNGNKEEAG